MSPAAIVLSILNFFVFNLVNPFVSLAKTANPSKAELLADGFFDGDILEILIFETSLTTSQKQAITQYLSGKWKIPASSLIYVDTSSSHSEEFGTEHRPIKTISNALKAVKAGGQLTIKTGSYNEAPLGITKNVKLRTINGNVRVK